mgnify:FL=1
MRWLRPRPSKGLKLRRLKTQRTQRKGGKCLGTKTPRAPWSRRVKTGSICRTKRLKPQPRRLRRETAPFARDDEFLAAMLEESIAFCGGRETDARGTLEQTAKRLGFTYEALMQGAADGIAVGRVVAQVKREHPVFATRN